MQPQIERSQHPEKHGHGGHGGHDEHGEEGEGEGDAEGGPSEDGEGGEGEPSEGKSDDSGSDSSGSDDTGKDTPDTSDDEDPENTTHEKEGGQDVEGVQFKGATSGGTRDGEQGDTRKHIPDAKGFNKKRIESDYGGKEGEAQNPEQDPSNKDLVTIAPYTASLRMAISLTIEFRPLHPSLLEAKTRNLESRKDFQIPTPSIPPILPMTPTRAPKVKVRTCHK